MYVDGIWKLEDLKVYLTLKNIANPKFLKARSVPYAMRLEGILQPVAHSDDATPTVSSLKNMLTFANVAIIDHCQLCFKSGSVSFQN